MLLSKKKVQEEIIFFSSVFVTNIISRRLNMTTTLMNFCRINFFNTCAAPASYRVNRFGCGFLLQSLFFTEHIPIDADQCRRHKLSGYSKTKLKNIWLFILIISVRLSSIFSHPMSELLLPTGLPTFLTEHATNTATN